MAKQDISIGTLVDKVNRGELILPEMQRRYVWTSTKVRDLLDSLYREYPSGSVLVWETDKVAPSRNLAVEQTDSSLATRLLLLDGQQRITSLTAIISGKPVQVRNVRRPIDIMFNLEHPVELNTQATDTEGREDDDDDEGDDDLSDIEESIKAKTFVVYARALEANKQWVKVTDIFTKSDRDILRGLGLTSEDERWDKYSDRIQRVRRIKDYSYVMHILGREYEYEEVTEIFVRVNSSGVKLRGSDLALAQITARWPGSLQLFEKFAKECKDYHSDLDLGLLVRLLVVFATKQSKFNTVGGLSKEQLEAAWKEAKDGCTFALDFMRQNTLFESISMLSSPFIIVPIAVISQQRGELDQVEEAALCRWVHLAHTFGWYSHGSSETILNADIATIWKKSGSASDLIEQVRQRISRLSVEVYDFEGKGKRSALFPLAYLAVKKNGGKDWYTGLAISQNIQSNNHRIQFHHIFPRKLLREAGYEQKIINEVANMAFIGGRTNRRISARQPYEYLEEIVAKRGEEALVSQFIPMDRSLWRIEKFPEFLAERRKLLVKAANLILDQTSK
ncbi:MAG: DUF262 domain-containing protein [Proteobacteria bacterium]|nr:MAG: DUF262 domain-containing protein [Pseudomonadota bacterium]